MNTLNYADLDVGIRNTVRLLRDAGFETTDSGDGVSKPQIEGCTLPVPHVFAHTTPVRAFKDAARMARLLGKGWHVELSYSTADQQCFLLAIAKMETSPHA